MYFFLGGGRLPKPGHNGKKTMTILMKAWFTFTVYRYSAQAGPNLHYCISRRWFCYKDDSKQYTSSLIKKKSMDTEHHEVQMKSFSSHFYRDLKSFVGDKVNHKGLLLQLLLHLFLPYFMPREQVKGHKVKLKLHQLLQNLLQNACFPSTGQNQFIFLLGVSC